MRPESWLWNGGGVRAGPQIGIRFWARTNWRPPRRCTYAGRPFGNESFASEMSQRFGRYRERGRPKKQPVPANWAGKPGDQWALFLEEAARKIAQFRLTHSFPSHSFRPIHSIPPPREDLSQPPKILQTNLKLSAAVGCRTR